MITKCWLQAAEYHMLRQDGLKQLPKEKLSLNLDPSKWFVTSGKNKCLNMHWKYNLKKSIALHMSKNLYRDTNVPRIVCIFPLLVLSSMQEKSRKKRREKWLICSVLTTLSFFYISYDNGVMQRRTNESKWCLLRWRWKKLNPYFSSNKVFFFMKNDLGVKRKVNIEFKTM